MSFFQCCFHSDCLGMGVNVNVILPQGAVRSQIGMDSAGDGEKLPPVLYLLHGLSDDQTIWMRRSSIERYASERGIAVVMPCGNRSFYCNTVDGMRFYDYISEELPALIGRSFRVSQRREDTAIGGLSMGGYGALRIGLLNPQKYCAIAPLSAVIRAEWVKEVNPALSRADFGDIALTGTQYDLFHLVEKLVGDKALPKPVIYQACGEQDGFLADNLRFRDHLTANGIAPKWVAAPGTHCWEFWDARIREVLAWLPFNR